MIQLVQLQQLESEFSAQDAAVVFVFREEQFGLHEIRKRLRVDYTLGLDLEGQETAAYGVGLPYSTFFIDPRGQVRAILDGETYDRPTGVEILEQLSELTSKFEAGSGDTTQTSQVH